MLVPQDTNQEMLLIHQLKEGSFGAFDQIYQMYARRLYAYSLQFTKSPEESEEIIQDVFVKLWTNRERIRQEDTLRSLLFVMVKHHVINAFRSKINQPVYEEYVLYKETLAINDAHQHLEYREFAVKIKQILKTLPLTQQKVISLSRIKELSNKEIAEKLGLSEQTVKNSLSVGLKKLREKLNDIDLYLLFFINFTDYFGTI